MGNAQSNRSGRYSTASGGGGKLSANRISGPQSLSSSSHPVSPPVRRRASAHPANPAPHRDLRSDPTVQPQTHRRARSALATSSNSIRNRDTAPPPTYSVAIADTTFLAPPPTPLSPVVFPSPPLVTTPPSPLSAPAFSSPGSSYTRVMSMPAPTFPLPHLSSPESGPSRTISTPRHHIGLSNDPNRLENEFEYLALFNTVFVVDDSASMRGQRWEEVTELICQLADRAAKHDTDGIDICFFNSKHVLKNATDTSKIRSLFEHIRPKGLSLMGYRLENLLLYYLDALEKAKTANDNGDPSLMEQIKPVNYIVITDGFPTDAPEDVIVAAARRLNAGQFSLMQVGIQIVQVGDNPDATEFLRRLDDDLPREYGCRDIVDTTPYTPGEPLNEKALLKILVGAINGRVDRIQNVDLHDGP